MAKKQTTTEQQPAAEAKATEPKASRATKLICKGPQEVSVHTLEADHGDDPDYNQCGMVGGRVLRPGQSVDVSDVPDYVITDEIRDGESALLELVTPAEAANYTPIPEGDIVTLGMEIPHEKVGQGRDL